MSYLCIVYVTDVHIWQVVSDVFASRNDLAAALGASYNCQARRQWLRVLGSADILGNPLGLLESISGGVLEFFRAPVAGFMSDGLLGLGVGVGRGVQALVLLCRI